MTGRDIAQGWRWGWAALGRTLSFRLSRADVAAFDGRCLLIGLVFVWLVGVGRYWDAPDADLFERLGLGSLIYALFLSFLLWVVALPVAKHPLRYLQVLTFVAMTAPPGLIYAIPVEWWADVNTAAAINGWFLAFVALYRVTLLGLFYRRVAGLVWPGAGFLTLVPLELIAVGLAGLRLDTVTEMVGRSMAGMRGEPTSVAEHMDVIIFGIGLLALYALPVIGLGYIIWIVRRHWHPAPSHEKAC